MRSRFRSDRWIVYGCIIAAVARAVTCFGATTGLDRRDEVDKATLLKKFLTTPPIVSSVTFEKTTAAPQTNLTASPSPSPVIERFEGRWQSGSVFLRQASDWRALENHSLSVTNLLISAHDGEFWLFAPESKFADRWIKPTGFGAEKPNYIRSEVIFQTRLLSEVLNFGVMYAAPGSLEWDGDNFTAEAIVPLIEVRVRIEGKLLHSQNGEPAGFHLIYRYPTSLAEHRVAFGYEDPPPGWNLPTSLTCAWTDGQNERELFQIVLRDIRIRTNMLSKEFFDTSPFLEANHRQIRLLQGTNRYLVLPNGQMKFSDSVGNRPERASPPAEVSPPAFVYISWAGLNLGIILLSVKMTKNQKQTMKG